MLSIDLLSTRLGLLYAEMSGNRVHIYISVVVS